MATSDAALMVMARALWQPKPTTNAKSERFLAMALGYPATWHVVRRIEVVGDDDDRTVIVDRIFAGDPSEGSVDMWFHHAAAQAAAAEWTNSSTPFDQKGGHLLPKKPKFQKGNSVLVLYDDEWCPATIQKRNERKDGFYYSVVYAEDNSRQSGVAEELIKLMSDPSDLAKELGLTSKWQAMLAGKKWKFIAPDGKTFATKASALKHETKLEKEVKHAKKKEKSSKSTLKTTEQKLLEDDPPWRTTGHPYIGRRVQLETQHKKSATRVVTITQQGVIVGWISDTDTDSHGEPGFVSERTKQPACLFHVKFEDQPSHPYLHLLVDQQDMEDYEVQAIMVPVCKEVVAGTAGLDEEVMKADRNEAKGDGSKEDNKANEANEVDQKQNGNSIEDDQPPLKKHKTE